MATVRTNTEVVRPDPYWLMTSVLIIVDQLTKLLTVGVTKEHALGPLSFGRLINSDGALGLSLSNPQLILLAVVICLLILFLLIVDAKKPPARLGLWLVLGGAFSNLLDRIFAGGAVDLVSIAGSPWFNLADIFIVLGAAWMLRSIWWRRD